MIDKYYLFSDSQEISYLLGPEGFNADPQLPYNEIKAWRFFDGESNLYFVTHGNDILAFFAKGDELIDHLKQAGVVLAEIETKEKTLNGVLPHYTLVDGGVFEVFTGDSTFINCQLKNKDETTLFRGQLDQGFSHTALHIDDFDKKFKMIRRKLFEDSVKLASTADPDESGNPPAWVQARQSKMRGQAATASTMNAVWVVVLILLVLIYLIFA